MKHLFQSRDMEKGREGMEGMGGREQGGGGKRKKVVEGTEEREERDARLLCAE